MSDNRRNDSVDDKALTIMFYFAGDNELSPLFVSQLKAIKDAGYQQRTNVLAHFDSGAPGVPTRIFNVNQKRIALARQKGVDRTHVGDGTDPFVRDMLDDHIDPRTMDPSVGPYTQAIQKALADPDAIPATDALKNFLGFCAENYPARNYILFLVGHGMIVGNDKFLLDDEPDSGISLKDLGVILKKFSTSIGNSVLQLLALQSCSMSSLEVAYELRGTAKYMMASEGLSYVGSWPYRQLLKETFNHMENANSSVIAQDQWNNLVELLYRLCLYSSTDFVISGYSFDLCLCQLSADAARYPGERLAALVRALMKGLEDPAIVDLIQLSHLKSQSFWQESYTDLVDFCLCLSGLCTGLEVQGEIRQACSDVIDALKPDRENRFGKLIVHADHYGWEYQYSNGLAIFFPWCRPLGRKGAALLDNYEQYSFTTELGSDSWLSFLDRYFTKTMRPIADDGAVFLTSEVNVDKATNLSELLNAFGPEDSNKPSGATGLDKPSGAGGLSCGCGSIKNYPITMTTIKGKVRSVQVFSATHDVLQRYSNE